MRWPRRATSSVTTASASGTVTGSRDESSKPTCHADPAPRHVELPHRPSHRPPGGGGHGVAPNSGWHPCTPRKDCGRMLPCLRSNRPVEAADDLGGTAGAWERSGMDAAPFVTICIVTGRRIPLLDACLASLQAQVDPPQVRGARLLRRRRRRRRTRCEIRFPDRADLHVDRAHPARLATSCSSDGAGRAAAVPRRRRDGAARSCWPGWPRSRRSASRRRRVRRPERLPRRQHPLPVRAGRGHGVDRRRRTGAAALRRASRGAGRRAVLHPLQPRGPAGRRCCRSIPTSSARRRTRSSAR